MFNQKHFVQKVSGLLPKKYGELAMAHLDISLDI